MVCILSHLKHVGLDPALLLVWAQRLIGSLGFPHHHMSLQVPMVCRQPARILPLMFTISGPCSVSDEWWQNLLQSANTVVTVSCCQVFYQGSLVNRLGTDTVIHM